MALSLVRQLLAELDEDETPICYYCSEELDSVTLHPVAEHKLPRCRGGTNERANLALSCDRCNTLKARQTAEEFIARGGLSASAWRSAGRPIMS